MRGKTIDSSSSGVAFSIEKLEPHKLVARLRCVDSVERASISPWSEPVLIPIYGFTKVVSVDSSLASNVYGIGTVIPIKVVFDSIVIVEGTPTLTLATGGSSPKANYKSGSGSKELLFEYTVLAGDFSPALSYLATSSLDVSSASIKNAEGVSAKITLPGLDSLGSLAKQTTLVIKGIPPAGVTSVGFSVPATKEPAFNLSWQGVNDQYLNRYDVRMCKSSDCQTDCHDELFATNASTSVSGTNGHSYYGCVQTVDIVGNRSTWISSLNPIAVDTSSPIVQSVSSPTADGYYKAGDVIDISLNFNEDVYAYDPNVTLQLETGPTDRLAVYHSKPAPGVLIFRYTVQAGDQSQDLQYSSGPALLVGTSVVDQAGNILVATLPTFAGSSLANNKAIVVDTTAPSAPSVSAPNAYSTSRQVAISYVDGTDLNYKGGPRQALYF